MPEFMPAITDWDDAYANADHIPGATDFIANWEKDAEAYRQQSNCELDVPYGSGARNKTDFFYPQGDAIGTVIFIHGGYWLRFDKSYWSHLASSLVSQGYAVAMPAYTLCPENSIGGITNEVTAAVTQIAEKLEGPIILAGHSAGGHLATRLVCTDTNLSPAIQKRISKVVSISGVHDLRPLLKTKLNDTLGLSPEQAALWSPALLQPIAGLKLHCVVGADERPEFVRQNALLANVWQGLGTSIKLTEVPDRHHFDVIEQIADFI